MMDSTNRAYRKADIARWQTLDFVIGYEIHSSNNPAKNCAICSKLAGKYPKSFTWDGWHPQCMCYATPIMEDYFSKSRSDDRVDRLKAALNGTEYTKLEAKNVVEYVPENFIDWFMENRKAMNESGNKPDFVTQNINIIASSYGHYKGIQI